MPLPTVRRHDFEIAVGVRLAGEIDGSVVRPVRQRPQSAVRPRPGVEDVGRIKGEVGEVYRIAGGVEVIDRPVERRARIEGQQIDAE